MLNEAKYLKLHPNPFFPKDVFRVLILIRFLAVLLISCHITLKFLLFSKHITRDVLKNMPKFGYAYE